MAASPLLRPLFVRDRPRPARRSTAALAALLGLLALGASRTAAAQSADCGEWTGELTAVEGTAEIQRAGTATWLGAASGAQVCLGDSIRVHRSARALLTLPDRSTLRLDANTTVILEPPAPTGGSLINLVRGLIHVISRDPRQLRFTTPYSNAGLEGTEFDIGVNEGERQTEVAVLEGVVRVTTPTGELRVTRSQLGVAREGAVPTAAALPAPIERMRWTSQYESILDGALPDPEGDAPAAGVRDPEFFARRAAARLGTARIEAAQADLATALAIAPNQPTALAIEGMIALARADVTSALASAARAVAADGHSVPALLALSHAEQAAGDLGAAERAARAALTAGPGSAVASTRLAELRLGGGDATAAIELAERAHALAPTRSRPLVVLGFAQLGAFDTARAEATFQQAVMLEPDASEPRLGLALVAARRGDVTASRHHLELAVASNPTDGLTRSYMAQLYDTEHRDELTGTQLEIAKTLNPADSTPWLYGALNDLSRNRPVEALRQLRAAAERNGDEAVFRSGFILDEDLATRSAGVSRIYTGLGFGRLALLDAWRAVNAAPAEHAGHRLLADAYASEPRHEIARVSELLVAQLLQPANVTPIKPQLGQPGLALAQRLGPSPSSFDEFTAPIAHNGPKLSASSIAGGNGTLGTELTVAGLNDRVSYSAGHYRLETDGFRANNDFDQEIANAFVQFRPNHDTSLQAEIRAVRSEQGDVSTLFSSDSYSRTQRLEQDTDSIRLGAQRRLSPADSLLVSFIHQDLQAGLADPGSFEVDTERSGYSLDVQHLRTGADSRFQSGLLYASQDERNTQRFGPVSPITTDTELRQLAAYGYWHRDLSQTFTLTLGASLDRIEDNVTDDAVNPKLGLLWRPTSATTVRAAAFKTLFGSLTTSAQNPQPRLEPVQIAGFTQLLFGGTADRGTVQGFGIDHTLTERLFVGWETVLRDTDRPILIPTGTTHIIESLALEESTHQAYVLFTPSDRLSLHARHERVRSTSEPLPFFGTSRMTIRRTPLEARYFLGNGFTFGARATHVQQDGLFEVLTPSPFDPITFSPGSDDFVIVDAFASYRLPNRRGIVSVTADNLLDERFQFQDVDPTNPTLIPERLLSIRFTLAFD